MQRRRRRRRARSIPNHGLIFGDNGDINLRAVRHQRLRQAERRPPAVTVTLPGSTTPVPALDALREWVRFAVRTPKAPFTTSRLPGAACRPRRSRRAARCSPSRLRELPRRRQVDDQHQGLRLAAGRARGLHRDDAGPAVGDPVGAQYLNRFLRDIGSFNLGVSGAGNPIGSNVGAVEKATSALNGVVQAAPDALGIDYNNDGQGNGFNVPSLLGIDAVPPYYHNGACETLACVVGNLKHRTANGKQPDGARTRRRGRW